LKHENWEIEALSSFSFPTYEISINNVRTLTPAEDNIYTGSFGRSYATYNRTIRILCFEN